MDNLKCPFCSYSSPHNSEVSIHMKVVHFGIPEEEEDLSVPEKSNLKKKIHIRPGDGSWLNGCEFYCPRATCTGKKVYHTKNSLTKHWQLVHNGTVESLADQDVKNVIRYFVCKKCDGRVQRDRDSIRVHLRKLHSCSIREYEKENGWWHDGEVKEEYVFKRSKNTMSRGPKSKRLRSDLDNVTITTHANEIDENEARRSHIATNRMWYDGCEYRCPVADLCGKVFPTWCGLTRHWKVSHKESVESLSDCDVKKVIRNFDCQKCERQVRRDPDCIHLHRYHGISMKEYGEEFGCGERDDNKSTPKGSEDENGRSNICKEDQEDDDEADSELVEAFYSHEDSSESML